MFPKAKGYEARDEAHYHSSAYRVRPPHERTGGFVDGLGPYGTRAETGGSYRPEASGDPRRQERDPLFFGSEAREADGG